MALKEKRDIFEYVKKTAEELSDESRLVRQTSELIGLLNKVVKGYRLYPRNNPMFAAFAGEFQQKLEAILSNVQVISYRITYGGFFFGKHPLGAEGSDNAISFMLYNDGVRELYFQQGVTQEEITRLFNILARVTIYSSEDYDIPTLLWEEHFENIGYITEDELVRTTIIGHWVEDDDTAPFKDDELAFPYLASRVDLGLDIDGEGVGSGMGLGAGSGAGAGGGGIGGGHGSGEGGGIGSGSGSGIGGPDDGSGGEGSAAGVSGGGDMSRTWEYEEISDRIVKHLATEGMAQPQINTVNFLLTRDDCKKFQEVMHRFSDSVVTAKFLQELSSRMTSGSTKSAEELVETASMLWEKLILFGSVRGAIVFIRTLLALADRLHDASPVFYDKVKEGLTKLGNDEFIDDVFEITEDIEEEELAFFGEFLALVPSEKLHSIVSHLTQMKNKSIRLACIDGLAKHIKISDHFKELLQNDDWMIVRNALSLLKYNRDPQLIPLIRQVVNHAEKGTRIEAISLLMNFSAEEALPALEKAVKSPDKEVRIQAFEKIIETSDNRTKIIINRTFHENYLSTIEIDEIVSYFTIVIDYKRNDLYDLIAAQLHASPAIRAAAVEALKKIDNLASVAPHLARYIASASFDRLKKDEIIQFMKLITPATYSETLPALKKVLFFPGGMFAGQKKDIKETVIVQLASRHDDPVAIKWLRGMLSECPKDTAALINKYAWF